MSISVRLAAQRLGLSEQRVRQLLANGDLPGEQISGRWVVDDAGLGAPRAKSRPLSERMAWALLGALSGEAMHLHDMERSRVKDYRRRLQEAEPDEAVQLLHSWLARRADRLELACSPADLANLRADPRLIASGYSAREARLAAGSDAEGYVLAADVDALRREFLLIESARPNVWLHVVRESHNWDLLWPALVAADLADHGGPRESARAAEILSEIAS